MKQPVHSRRTSILALSLALALALSISLPASASLLDGAGDQTPSVSAFSKNGTLSSPITFSAEDFKVTGDVSLDSIILKQLPDSRAGLLLLGGQPLASGDIVTISAVDGMSFSPLASPGVSSASMVFTPVFSNGAAGADVAVGLHLLAAENNAPVAENLEFSTYKNVAYTGRFAAVDPEGDLISFQLVDSPARGAVTLPEDGSGQFVYTPYENKTGKDSFTYTAVDAVGNSSEPATVKIKIEKPDTKITYVDMEGHPACNAALTLAAEEIYVGSTMDGAYFFHPEAPVTRSEFVALAMAATGLEALEGVTATGFWDDAAIDVWAKPYVSSALKSGVIQGTISPEGQVVFQGDNAITAAEATVLLNRLLSVTDVAADAWEGDVTGIPAWACQAAMNLETVGVLHADVTGALSLGGTITRGEAAQMLCAALDVLEAREEAAGWFHW